ncbi:MAG: hypothetical protein QXZ68_05555 [Candidatus Bathyarchaeia archaeon]
MAKRVDSGRLEAEWIIEKYHGDFKSREEAIKKGAEPYEVIVKRKNLFLAEGIQLLLQLAIGTSGLTPWNATNAHIGVGDGTADASRDQTGLQGTNKYYKGMDSGYPTVEEDTSVSPATYRAVFQATFGGDEANFSWNELTVANGPGDTYVNWNRLVGNFGTKSSGSTWIAQLRLRIV